jgi:hypothetical protein
MPDAASYSVDGADSDQLGLEAQDDAGKMAVVRVQQ